MNRATPCFIITSIILFCIQNTLNAQTEFNLHGYIDRNLKEISFIDNSGNDLNIMVYKDIDEILLDRLTSGLRLYDKRVELYRNLITELILQRECSEVDLIVQDAKSGVSPEDLLAQAGYLYEIGSYSLQLIEYISNHVNLGYIPGIDNSSKIINSWKHLLRNAKHSNLHNINNALNAISLIMNLIEAGDRVAAISGNYVLLKALELDLTAQRLKIIEEECTITDSAFWEAISEVKNDIQSVSESEWMRLLTSIRNNPEEVENLIIVLGESIHSLGSLLSHSHAVSPLSGWLFAALFTWKTGVMIQDHEDHLRVSSLAATIYANLEYVEKSYIINEISEYSQYLFVNEFNNAFDYWTIDILSIFSSNWREFIISWQDMLTDILIKIKMRRIQWAMNDYNDSDDSTVAIGFIIDSSGSMQTNDPDDLRKQILELLISARLNPRDNIFLIDFDSQATWLNQNNWQNWSESQLIDQVRRINSDGGTNIQGGLDKLREVFESSGINYNNCSVILLTDGNGDYQDGADWYMFHNIPVNTVSFVGNVNESLLIEISERTGGEYMRANYAQDIFTIFQQVYTTQTGGNTFFSKADTIAMGQTIMDEFYVDCILDFLSLQLSWQGSKIDLILYSPSGIEFSDSNGNGEWIVRDNFVAIKIENPEIGKWKTEFIGVNIPEKGEEFTFQGYANPDIVFHMESDTLKDDMFTEPLTYKLSAKNEDLINEYNISLSMKTPEGNTVDISGNLKDNEFSFIPTAGKGYYIFQVDIHGKRKDGSPFQRYLERHLYVGKYIPAFIKPVTDVLGSFVYTDIGSLAGNSTGLHCYIYRGDPNNEDNLIANGYISHCFSDYCIIEIFNTYIPGHILINDIVKIDENEWKRDFN